MAKRVRAMSSKEKDKALAREIANQTFMEREGRLWMAAHAYLNEQISLETLKEIEYPYNQEYYNAMLRSAQREAIPHFILVIMQFLQNLWRRLKRE